MATLLDANGNPILEVAQPGEEATPLPKIEEIIPEKASEEKTIQVHVSKDYGMVIARAMNVIIGTLPTLTSHKKQDRIYHDQRVEAIGKLCMTIRDEVVGFITKGDQPVTEVNRPDPAPSATTPGTEEATDAKAEEKTN